MDLNSIHTALPQRTRLCYGIDSSQWFGAERLIHKIDEGQAAFVEQPTLQLLIGQGRGWPTPARPLCFSVKESPHSSALDKDDILGASSVKQSIRT